MSDADGQQKHLNGHSGFLLAVFCVVSALVIWPVKLLLPTALQRLVLSALLKCKIIGHNDSNSLSTRRLHIHLSLTTAPVLTVILLLATTTIHGSTIRLGIVGDANIKPYDVLVLFISLAYISIALDGTGALEATAFYVSKRGGSSGHLLFTYLYVFFLLTACIVGNDPLILSGTPFLAYLAQHTGLDPTAWIFAEFMAANTASAVLVSSNPTNILITGSFNLNYLTDFTKWTVLPSLIPAALNYPILLAMFWKKIPTTLTPLTDDPWSKLRDKTGAFFLSGLMLVTVAVLVGTSFVPGHGAQVWMVTAPAGVTAFLYNIVTDVLHPEIGAQIVRQRSRDSAAEMAVLGRTASKTNTCGDYAASNDKSTAPIESANAEQGDNVGSGESSSSPQNHSRSPTLPAMDDREVSAPDFGQEAEAMHKHNGITGPSITTLPPPTKDSNTPPLAPIPSKPNHKTLLSLLRALSTRFPSTTTTISRLPLTLLPFAAAEFILVRGLAQRGWIRVFAIGFGRACTSTAATVYFFSFVSAAFLCPLAGTNIGATILLVEIIRHPEFMASIARRGKGDGERILNAAIYSVAMGSNIGAFSYTFAGSLAGLLWRGLLEEKGVLISQWTFARVNALSLLMQIVVSGAIVLGEVYWFG